MSLWGDDRGAAIQVGAAILFAFVIIAITTYQVEVVPNQNAEIEFDHNQDVQDQFQELRNDAVGVSDGNSGGSQSVTLGTTYPARTIFVNPGPASGSLQTVEPGDDGNITIENATVDAEDGTEDYWDGERDWSTPTRAIEYRPNYNVYQQAPVTVYEHSALYNRHPNDRDLPVADQLLIEDDQLTVIALRGDLQESSTGSVSVRTRALSRTANTVDVKPEDDETIELTIPTERPGFWADELEDDVADVDPDPDENEITIDLDDSYDLRMAEVGVGQVDRGSPDERAEYVVEVDDRAPTVVAQVRDKFNNPVRNFENFTVEGGTKLNDRTDSEGRIRIGNVQDGDTVTVEIFDGDEPYESVEIDVRGGGGGGGGSAYDVDWNTTEIDDQNANVDCDGDECTITDDDTDPTFYMETSPGADGADVDFSVGSQSVGTFDPATETTDSDGTAETTFEIQGDDGDRTDAFVSSGGDGDSIEVELDFDEGEEFEELSIDVEGGGGGGGGGAAYEVNWNQDKIEAENNNVDECNGDCEITGSAGDDAELFMGTSPTADGANVDFSVSDQSVGTVDPNSETTDSDGEASTMFEIDSGAEASESVTVFTSSGGDGDQLTMALNLTDEGVGGTVVFTSANDNEIRTVAEQDSVINVGQEADVIGPLTSDLDRDEEEKIPYVDGNELRLVAADGTGDELLVDPSGPDGVNPFNGVSLLAVGRWDGAPMSVYFVGSNEETIYRHDEDMDTGDAIEVVEPENGVGAVVGIADVTGNGTDELVYADGSQELRYIGAGSGDSPTGTVMTDDIGENNGIGVGRPADFNGDGSARVPVVDGDDRLVLASDDGSTEFVTDELVTKSPVAPIDWDGDGNLEIVFAADNGTIQYVDNPLETPSVRTASDEEEPREETGIT